MRSIIHWIFGIPLLYKVLLANGLVVVLGATVGTLITARTVQGRGATDEIWLMCTFAAVGIVLSLGVNYLVLRAALQPIDRLAEVAERVKAGDFSSRVRPSRFPDPQLARFGSTFNETLDELESDRDQLRQLTSQVINAQEDERKRIARELHDDTAQVLFAQLLRLTALKASDHDQVRAAAEALELSTVDAIEGVRRLALELRPRRSTISAFGLRSGSSPSDTPTGVALWLTMTGEARVSGFRPISSWSSIVSPRRR